MDILGVRRGTEADAEALVAFVCGVLSEEELQPVSPTRVATVVNRCCAGPRAIVGIIDGPSGIEASVGMEHDSPWSSDNECLVVRWLGTAPQHRRGNHGARLFRFMEWMQESVSETAGRVVPIIMSLATIKDLGPKFHLYSRLSQQIGATFAIGMRGEGLYAQRHVGHDPFGEFMKKTRAERRA